MLSFGIDLLSASVLHLWNGQRHSQLPGLLLGWGLGALPAPPPHSRHCHCTHSVCFMHHYFQEAPDPSPVSQPSLLTPTLTLGCHSVCASVPLLGPKASQGQGCASFTSRERWACTGVAAGKGVPESGTAWVKAWPERRRGTSIYSAPLCAGRYAGCFIHNSAIPHNGSRRRVGCDFRSTEPEAEPHCESRRSEQSHPAEGH